MAKTSILTEKQELFSVAMFTIGSMTFDNGTESARVAQYKGTDNYLAMVASRNIRNDKIILRKEQLQAKSLKEAGVTNQEVLDEFKTIGFGKVSKELTNKNKISALENIGKHIGFYEKDNSQKKDTFSELVIAIGANGVGIQIK